jgi:hypothetical protein
MHPSLVTLIERFREAQDRGVAFIVDVLGPALGVRLPKSPTEWVTICGETGLYNVRWVNGVEVYSHGYGIELSFGGLTIDFDWGEAGEPDGFDGWWLWNFARLNPCNSPCPERAQVRLWIENAATAGELTRDLYLYYSAAHRAEHRPTEPAASPDRCEIRYHQFR